MEKIKGLELAQLYYEVYGKPMIEEKYPGYRGRIAAGLVGHGSECLGFDDEISRDHDFGPGFCLWLSGEDYARIGERLQADYERLPQEFLGFSGRNTSPQGGGRVGVFETGAFYRGLIGYERAPEKLIQWLYVPEEALAGAVNGKVFADPLGEFTQIRESLSYYPEDVRLKKLARRLAVMAQSGQYNFPRAGKRGDLGAVYFSLAEFCRAAVSAVYLLNRVYAPFYKWQMAGMDRLSILKEIKPRLLRLMSAQLSGAAGGRWTDGGSEAVSSRPSGEDPGTSSACLSGKDRGTPYGRLSGGSEEPAPLCRMEEEIEEICVLVVEELKRQGLSGSWETFLEVQKGEVEKRICDGPLRTL